MEQKKDSFKNPFFIVIKDVDLYSHDIFLFQFS